MNSNSTSVMQEYEQTQDGRVDDCSLKISVSVKAAECVVTKHQHDVDEARNQEH